MGGDFYRGHRYRGSDPTETLTEITSRYLPSESHSEIGRSPFERDVDRIQHSRYFRRLKNVTQVARASETYLYHDRLSHSLKVARVARGLAQLILRREVLMNRNNPPGRMDEFSMDLASGWNISSNDINQQLDEQLDPDVVEAAALAHDIGHPPFGHLAESELDDLLVEKTYPDSFQTIITEVLEKLDVKWRVRLPHNVRKDLDQGRLHSQWSGTSIPPVNPVNTKQKKAEISELLDDNNMMFNISRCSLDPAEDNFDPDVVDAFASLADVDPIGIRFEGNAQSFRIATRLGYHQDSEHGMGLTTAVLNGILKYPYGRGEHFKDSDWTEGKFGYYETEKSTFEFVRDEFPDTFGKTIEAAIMDFADDLTYAVHDLTDFYKDGRLPLDQLFKEASEEYETEATILDDLSSFISDENEDIDRRQVHRTFAELAYVAQLFGLKLFQSFEGTDVQRDHLSFFTSYLISNFLDAGLKLTHGLVKPTKNSSGRYKLDIRDDRQAKVDILQDTTKYFVLDDSTLMAQQKGQRKIIRELFEAIYEEAQKQPQVMTAIPEPYRTRVESTSTRIGVFRNQEYRIVRVVSDFIASMTERQAVDMHKRLTGASPGSLQDEIIQ